MHRILPALVCLAGCAPAGHALVPLHPQAVTVESSDQVLLTARAEAWPGEALIEERVTPLRVEIDNRSAQPADVDLAGMVLVGASGRTYAALAPERIDGTTTRLNPSRPFVDGVDAERPPFDRRYRGTQPGTRYQGPYRAHDRYRYPRSGEWGSESLPTPEMLARALPEGPVAPGRGLVSGWVYFEKLDEEEGSTVLLKVSLRAPKTDEVVAAFAIPFTST